MNETDKLVAPVIGALRMVVGVVCLILGIVALMNPEQVHISLSLFLVVSGIIVGIIGAKVVLSIRND